MRGRSGRYSLGVAMAALILITAACQGEEAAPAPPEYVLAATVKDLMQSIIDESADVVWLAVTSVHSDQGIVDTRPRNDEEWNRVRFGALALAESANLLLMPGRPVARPGETSETPGVELEPEEMDALIAADREGWNRRAMALRSAALEALEAIEAQDPDRLFSLGENIELACEGCHSTYWYPNEVIPALPEDVPEP